MRKEIVKMLGNTDKSYYRWKEEGRPIIAFLEKYFNEEDLKEFLETGEISRLENDNSGMEYMLIEYARYNLKFKLDTILLNPMWIDISKKFPRKIFLDVIGEIKNSPKIDIQKYKSKEYLIERFEMHTPTLEALNKRNKDLVIKLIRENLSNIECYVLIKYPEEILPEEIAK